MEPRKEVTYAPITTSESDSITSIGKTWMFPNSSTVVTPAISLEDESIPFVYRAIVVPLNVAARCDQSSQIVDALSTECH